MLKTSGLKFRKMRKEAAMRNDRVLLILVVADFALVMFTLVAEFALSSTLPQPLRGYASLPEFTLADIALFPWWLAIVGATLVSWIGLLNYWWPSRILYVGAWLAWLVLVALSGPSVMTAAGAAIETLEHLVGGTIIGVVYFSDLSKRFEEGDLETAPA
jgi:hypothetical protein